MSNSPAFFKNDVAPGRQGALVPYEQRLNQNARWALTEGSLFFEDGGAVQQSMRRITQRLDELGVAYAIVGGMALFQHGFRRFTEDVDLLVTQESLALIHKKLSGRGYWSLYSGSKSLRDTELGVKIKFVITGEYPGDGKPKPVAFPDPAQVAVDLDGQKYLPLATLIELKLASGVTNRQRLKDLADVQEVIKLLNLPLEFADKLHPYVRDEFRELWAPAES